MVGFFVTSNRRRVPPPRPLRSHRLYRVLLKYRSLIELFRLFRPGPYSQAQRVALRRAGMTLRRRTAAARTDADLCAGLRVRSWGGGETRSVSWRLVGRWGVDPVGHRVSRSMTAGRNRLPPIHPLPPRLAGVLERGRTVRCGCRPPSSGTNASACKIDSLVSRGTASDLCVMGFSRWVRKKRRRIECPCSSSRRAGLSPGVSPVRDSCVVQSAMQRSVV